ncbi:MAG: glycosyltransferase [Chitinophagaceae bacterium]
MVKGNKVIHLLYSGLGGHGSVFFSLIKADKNREFHTEAIFCGIEEVRKDYKEQCHQWGVPYQFVPKRIGFDPMIFLRLFRAFRKAKPDVLFLHGATFILPALFYKKVHGKIKIIVRDTQAHHLKTRREKYWLWLAARHSDRLVFLTKESLAGAAQKINNLSLLNKAVVISNGLDTDLYSPVPEKNMKEKVVIGMQSRLQPIKDHVTLLKAFALLKEKLPDFHLSLRIAGDGETRKTLESLAKELQIENQTEFCGMLNEKDLIDFMHSLDIYIHASFGETMSNSIMQAMACGLPVIASDVWGINNMICNNETGILYKSEDESQLFNYMEQLINDTPLRTRISANARDYAVKEFSMQNIFKKYKELF